MQDTKPNRAQRRAAQSNSTDAKNKTWRSKRPPKYPHKHSPQIDAPSRATRFAGMT